MTRTAILPIGLLSVLLLVACGSDDPVATETTESPPTVVIQPPTTTSDGSTTTDAPPATDTSPTTQVPTTQPATTQPDTTQPATTQPDTTQPETIAPASTAPAAILPENSTVIDDTGFGSLQEMAAASELVVYGTVTDEQSLGRPHVDEDPTADEYLGLTVHVESVLKGDPIAEIRLGWDAYVIGANGERVATNVMNGIPVPHVGDRVVLFLRALDGGAVEFMSGFPTHGPVSLDGVAFVENGTVTVTDDISDEATGLRGRTIAEITALVS